LLDSPFQDPKLASLHIDIETFDAPREVELVEVALETPSVRPGEAVQAFVRLQPYRGEAEVRTLSISLPGDVPAGPLRMTLRGATVPDPDRDAMIEERERDPLEQVISDLPPIVSWGELLAALRNRPRARELLIEIPGEDRPRRLARIDLGDEEGVIVTGIEHLTVMVETDEAAPTDSETEDR
jgi:hypothetical protein